MHNHRIDKGSIRLPRKPSIGLTEYHREIPNKANGFYFSKD